MPIKNYTTEVAEERTVGEIMGLLAGKGARSIKIDYDERNRPSGVSFIILVNNVPIPFQLPCNFDGVFRAMGAAYKDIYARRKWERKPSSMDQARRVGWRIIKDWIASQIALIEAEQASLAQVFLPYANIRNGQGSTSVFEQFMEQVNRQKALPEAKGENE